MEAPSKRITGASLTDFLRSLGIVRIDPVGRSSASGESADDVRLTELLERGDPVKPGPGIVAEDAETLHRLFDQAGPAACFGLSPDGHLTSHQPLTFDADAAAEQVIGLVEATLASEDRDEALVATWLGLAYHNHDHPSDLAGLVRDAGPEDGPKCCYLDVKGTKAVTPAAQRTKLEQRARERKLGCMAQTVTTVDRNGFAGYPGRGKPGLLVTVLHNAVVAGKNHAGYAIGWFFGISSNFQAAAAVWGWGGPLGVKLPPELTEQLQQRTATIRGQTKPWLELLGEYRDYGQYRGAQGAWDRDTLRATLQAKALAARYLLMNENPVTQAEATVEDLQPKDINMPLQLEDFHPGESIAHYYGRKADAAVEKLHQAEEDKRLAVEAQRLAEEDKRQAEEAQRLAEEAQRLAQEAQRLAQEAQRLAEEAQRQAQERERKLATAARLLVTQQRQQGRTDAELANELGYTLEEFLQRFPPSS